MGECLRCVKMTLQGFKKGKKKTIEYIGIWMEAHYRQDKAFDTNSLIKYLKEEV